jgi:peroxiredoxin
MDQPELRVLQRAELEKWCQSFGEAQKIICRFPDIKTRSCNTEVALETP